MMQSGLKVFGESTYKRRITSVLIIFFVSAAVTIQAQSLIPALSFKNPVLKTGRGSVGDGLDGAVYIFENVGWNVDALVTILGRSSSDVHLSAADMQGPEQDVKNGTGEDDAWQPRIQYGDGTAPANKTWWMEFKVSFVKHYERNKYLAVNQFFVSGLDIDGDGKQLHEFQAFYKPRYFSLQPRTAIFASSVEGSESDPLNKGKRFDGPSVNYPGISTTAADATVSNFYTNTPFMIVRLGAETGKSGTQEANRMYALLFKSLAFDVPVPKNQPDHMFATN